MKSCLFRFLGDENPHWIGLAVAETEIGLFWQIDHHGDPHDCEIVNLPFKGWYGGASICVSRKVIHGATDDDLQEEIDCAELHGAIADYEDFNWQKPIWPENIV